MIFDTFYKRQYLNSKTANILKWMRLSTANGWTYPSPSC